jgi:hypothetical protein
MTSESTTDKPFRIEKRRVYEAYKAVKSNHGAAGVDGETLESVRRDHAGLHSFLSMSLIEARRRNASALRLRFSQSLARRLHRPSHRALELLGRRPPQRVDDLVIPASEKPAQQATSPCGSKGPNGSRTSAATETE